MCAEGFSMAKGLNGKGPEIHNETANAWTRRSRLFMSTPVAKGGMGLSKAKIDDIEKRLNKAGGAFLEWLEGKALPGVEALKAK